MGGGAPHIKSCPPTSGREPPPPGEILVPPPPHKFLGPPSKKFSAGKNFKNGRKMLKKWPFFKNFALRREKLRLLWLFRQFLARFGPHFRRFLVKFAPPPYNFGPPPGPPGGGGEVLGGPPADIFGAPPPHDFWARKTPEYSASKNKNIMKKAFMCSLLANGQYPYSVFDGFQSSRLS